MKGKLLDGLIDVFGGSHGKNNSKLRGAHERPRRGFGSIRVGK
jgi:hypothetical protein